MTRDDAAVKKMHCRLRCICITKDHHNRWKMKALTITTFPTMNYSAAFAASALTALQFSSPSSALSIYGPSKLHRSFSFAHITNHHQYQKRQQQNWALYAKDQQLLSSSDDVDINDISTDQTQQQQHAIIDHEMSKTTESSAPAPAHENETAITTNNPLLQKLFLGIEPTPDILAIMAIYFVEGALGLARLAQTFLLKDELHLGPAELSAISGLLILPWTIKPLYGFLSDGLPLFGYRRRSYLILAGIVGFSSYAFLAYGMNGVGEEASKDMVLSVTIALFMLSSASIAFSDVVADGIVVQKTREANEQGDNPALAGGRFTSCLVTFAYFISLSLSDSLLSCQDCNHYVGEVQPLGD